MNYQVDKGHRRIFIVETPTMTRPSVVLDSLSTHPIATSKHIYIYVVHQLPFLTSLIINHQNVRRYGKAIFEVVPTERNPPHALPQRRRQQHPRPRIPINLQRRTSRNILQPMENPNLRQTMPIHNLPPPLRITTPFTRCHTPSTY